MCRDGVAYSSRRHRVRVLALYVCAFVACTLQEVVVVVPPGADNTWRCCHVAALPYARVHHTPPHLPRHYHHLHEVDRASDTDVVGESKATACTRSAQVPREQYYMGRGVRVALLDSGLASDYAAHSVNVVECISVVPGVACHAPAHEHGTRSASVLAGHVRVSTTASTMPSDATQYTGVAPCAELLVWRVFDTRGRTHARYLDKALAMVRTRHVDVLVLPYGMAATTAASTTEAAHRVDAHLRALAAAHVIIVAAAGNDGPRWSSVLTPAASAHVMAVGALRARAAATTRNARMHPQRQQRARVTRRDACTAHAVEYTRRVAEYSSRGLVTWHAASAQCAMCATGTDVVVVASGEDVCARGVCHTRGVVKPEVVALGDDVLALDDVAHDDDYDNDTPARARRRATRLVLAAAHGTSIAAATVGGVVALCVEAMRAAGVARDDVHLGSVVSLLLRAALPLAPPRGDSPLRTRASLQAAAAADANAAAVVVGDGAGEVLACRAVAFAARVGETDATLLPHATLLPAHLCVGVATLSARATSAATVSPRMCGEASRLPGHAAPLMPGDDARTFAFAMYFARQPCVQCRAGARVAAQLHIHNTTTAKCRTRRHQHDARPRRDGKGNALSTVVRVVSAAVQFAEPHHYTGVLYLAIDAPLPYAHSSPLSRQPRTTTTRTASTPRTRQRRRCGGIFAWVRRWVVAAVQGTARVRHVTSARTDGDDDCLLVHGVIAIDVCDGVCRRRSQCTAPQHVRHSVLHAYFDKQQRQRAGEPDAATTTDTDAQWHMDDMQSAMHTAAASVCVWHDDVVSATQTSRTLSDESRKTPSRERIHIPFAIAVAQNT